MALSPDDVCEEYARRKVRISVRRLPGDENVILIEGDREGLEFLGKLFLAQARFSDCGFQIEPDGPGKALFAPSSTTGMYIHRLHKSRPPRNGRRNGKAHRKSDKASA